MSDSVNPDTCGDIRIAGQPPSVVLNNQGVDQYSLPLPAGNVETAQRFLEGLGGDAMGMGRTLSSIGVNAPALRAQYKREIEGMVAELERRLKAGEPKESVARWASAERNRIVGHMRAVNNFATRGMYTIRDWGEYGIGGRTWPNIERRYEEKHKLTGEAIHDKIINGARKSNEGVNKAAMRGASFLKHGGRVVLVVGINMTAARIWKASDEEMPRVLLEELGGYVGGGLGAGMAATGCIIFGVASAGWGLLACGVVGGLAGGIAGSYAAEAAADGIFYTDADKQSANHAQVQVSIEIPAHRLYRTIPDTLCHR